MMNICALIMCISMLVICSSTILTRPWEYGGWTPWKFEYVISGLDYLTMTDYVKSYPRESETVRHIIIHNCNLTHYLKLSRRIFICKSHIIKNDNILNEIYVKSETQSV